MSANFAFVNQATRTSQTGDSTTSVFPAQNVTTGNFIGVEVAFSNSNSTTATLADTAGNTYFNVGYARSSESGVEYNVGLWIVLSAIGNASNVITVTFSASSSYREGCAEQQSYDGTVELGDVAIGNSTSNTSPWPTSPDVDAVDGDLIFGGFTWFTNSFGGNAGTGYTSRGGDEFSLLQDQLPSSTITDTFQAQDTGSSDTYAGIGCVIQEVPAAGGNPWNYYAQQ